MDAVTIRQRRPAGRNQVSASLLTRSGAKVREEEVEE